jgi:hypothetical protein
MSNFSLATALDEHAGEFDGAENPLPAKAGDLGLPVSHEEGGVCRGFG